MWCCAEKSEYRRSWDASLGVRGLESGVDSFLAPGFRILPKLIKLEVCSFDSCDLSLCLCDQPKVQILQPVSPVGCRRLKSCTCQLVRLTAGEGSAFCMASPERKSIRSLCMVPSSPHLVCPVSCWLLGETIALRASVSWGLWVLPVNCQIGGWSQVPRNKGALSHRKAAQHMTGCSYNLHSGVLSRCIVLFFKILLYFLLPSFQTKEDKSTLWMSHF